MKEREIERERHREGNREGKREREKEREREREKTCRVRSFSNININYVDTSQGRSLVKKKSQSVQ